MHDKVFEFAIFDLAVNIAAQILFERAQIFAIFNLAVKIFDVSYNEGTRHSLVLT
jgi:hypothetical protein